MPRLLSVLLAEGTSIDQLTARVTAFNMVDHVLVPQLPALLLRLVVITQYGLGEEPEIFLERVRLVAPNGDAIANSQTTIILQPHVPNALPNVHRSIHMLWSSKITQEGDHRLVVETGRGDENWAEQQAMLVTVVVQNHPILNNQAPVSIPPVAPAAPKPAEPQSPHRDEK